MTIAAQDSVATNGTAKVSTRSAWTPGKCAFADTVRGQVSQTVVGQEVVVERVLIALLTGGHLLLEGVPGIAKTLMVQAVAKAIDLKFHRVQFTIDLLPSDIVGAEILEQRTSEFRVHKGPIFTNLLLADEINRASPKVQSALLRGHAGAPRLHRRHDPRLARPIPGHRHAEPHRAGRHV